MKEIVEKLNNLGINAKLGLFNDAVITGSIISYHELKRIIEFCESNNLIFEIEVNRGYDIEIRINYDYSLKTK